MELLETQEQFETLWFNTKEPQTAWIVYFTAAWCGPCKRLDCDVLAATAKAKGILIYKCDDTINDYTGGYCGVKAFPTFIYFNPKKVISSIQSNDTYKVIEWINSLPNRN